MNRFHLPTVLTLAIVLAMLAYGPIGQLADYHEFADQSKWLAIPHTADVLSNLGFALVGGIGLIFLWPRADHPGIKQAWPGYLLFLTALTITAVGSAWYHLAPDNARLIWDRLPIALGCAGLLAAVRSQAIEGTDAWLNTAMLGVFAALSVAWWALTEHYGTFGEQGDLRPYLLLQVLPLLLIPLWQTLYRARIDERIAFATAIGLYLVAKACELADHQILAFTGFISGHTIKHLLATAAAAVLVTHLLARTGRPISVVNRPGLPGGAGLTLGQSDRPS